MPPMNFNFDATQFNPEQGVGKHPVGKKFPAIIKATSIEATKDRPQEPGYLSVLFETPAGQIMKNYNLWNPNTQTVEIAQKQLSALCYATGVTKLDGQNEGAALRGAQLMIDVDPQAKNAEYNEVSKVYDRNGNEPGKAPGGAPAVQQQAPPQTGGWGNAPANAAPAPTAAPMTAQQGGGWGTPPQQQQPNQQPPQAQGWQQGQAPNPNEPPPWRR